MTKQDMAQYKGYSAVITTHHWDCGDGCCSDSWAHYRIINQFGVVEKDTERSGNGQSYRDSHSMEKEVRQIYGPEIAISFDDDYSQSSK